MTTPIYPEDLTGQAESNLVENEFHTLTEVNDDTYRILIPTFAPFYLNNLSVEHIDTMGVVTPLNEVVDYYPCLSYMAATRSTGKLVYGGLYINSRLVEGTIRIRKYQTIGGPWCADVEYVYQRLVESVYNKRSVWWDNITNVQEIFPPTEHEHSIPGLNGFEQLLERLQAIEAAILNGNIETAARLTIHMNDQDAHSSTKESVGLGKVANLEMATDEEVMNRVEADKYLTLRQVLMLLNTAP